MVGGGKELGYFGIFPETILLMKAPQIQLSDVKI